MLSERLLNAACLVVLVTTIAAFHPSVGQSVTGIVRGDSSTPLALLGSRGLRMARTAGDVVGSYAGDNSLLVFFAVGAVVFFGLMLRA